MYELEAYIYYLSRPIGIQGRRKPPGVPTMQNYETIGIAVRQHDAIRFTVVRGDAPRTLFASAESVAALFDGATIPLFQLGIADGYVIPQVTDATAEISSTGRSVLIRLGRDCLQIPTQQLTVHYMRDLGETSKIIRKIEGGPAPSAAAATAPALAVV